MRATQKQSQEDAVANARIPRSISRYGKQACSIARDGCQPGIQPLDGACRRRSASICCIGMAYGFSVFWLPLSRALGVTQPHACPTGASAAAVRHQLRLARRQLGLMFTLFFMFLGLRGCVWGGWLERAGPRKAGVVAARVLVRRHADVGARHLRAPALADLARVGRDRRHRPRAGLHLAGVHADQVVPGPARHGHRHGDHGVRRRRDDRRAAGRH